MIATTQDLMVLTEEDFDRLPEDGIFEVVDGGAILSPGNDIGHQDLLMALYETFRSQPPAGTGFVIPQANVYIPRPPDALSELQNRVPYLGVSTRKPKDRFRPGRPPELVIEIPPPAVGTSNGGKGWTITPGRGLASIGSSNRSIASSRCTTCKTATTLQKPSGLLRPQAFAGVEIDPQQIWAVLCAESYQ